MSNLLKSRNIVSQNERVIDYNEIIKSKIDGLLTAASKGKVGADGFISGLNAEVVKTLLDPNTEELVAQSDDPISQAEIELYNEKAQEIISNASIEAEKIISNANNQAVLINENAHEDGRERGLADAKREIAEQKAALVEDFEHQKELLKLEYDELKSKMEPELVITITDIFKQVIHVISDDNEEMIINLINSVMRKAESSREFIIKVSPEDYKFVLNNQGKIYCAMSKDVQIEIVEDSIMQRNQCIIECDTGVYDCSLDIQLEKLVKNIKLLSCI